MEKLETIHRIPRPQTKRQVRSFLGLVGWYQRFLPHFATIATPIINLTQKTSSSHILWTEECEEAFKKLQELLCQDPVLQSPDFTNKFLVQVDASDVGLGAILAQGEPGEERPILFLSQKLFDRERKYSTIEKEGLAIKWVVDSLRYCLLWQEFILQTDHRALKWMQSMQSHNSRILQWCLALQPYHFVLEYCPSRRNLIADYLSPLPGMYNPEERG